MNNKSGAVKRHHSFLKHDVDMISGPIVKSTVSYTIPIILSNMLANLYNAVDIAVVGNLSDTSSVASVGATATIIGLLVNIFISLGTGYSVILANAMGQNDSVRIGRVIRTGYTFSLILGVAVAFFGVIFSTPMLRVTECPEEIIGGASLYMKIYMLSVPASMFCNFNAGIIRLKGDTVRPFIYGAISGAVNIVMNIVLVLVTGEAVASVAWATVIANYVTAALFLVRLMRLEAPYKLNPFKLEINGDVLRKIIVYGVPSMISSATFSVTNIQVQTAINGFSAVGISGNTAAITIEAFIFSITNSVSGTLSAFVGQCIGADKRERVMQIIKKSYFIWGVIGAFVSVLVLLFGKNLLGFIIPGETEAIAFGEIRLRYIAIAAIVHALINVNHGALQGFGKTLNIMIVNIIGVCGFRLFWMLVIFPLSPTAHTLYMCYPISYLLILMVGIFMVTRTVKKYKRGDKIVI